MKLIKFDWDNYVILKDTLGASSHKWSAIIRDPVGLGSGNTQEEAVISLVKSLRQTADEIEQLVPFSYP